MERLPDGRLKMWTSLSDGFIVVTAAEVREHATAVVSGYFDPLLGGGMEK